MAWSRLTLSLFILVGTVLGVSLGVVLTRGGESLAAGETAARYLEVTLSQEESGTVLTQSRIRLWRSLDGDASRAEVRGPDGPLQMIQIRQLGTLETTVYADGSPDAALVTRAENAAALREGIELDILIDPQQVRPTSTSSSGIIQVEESVDSAHGRIAERTVSLVPEAGSESPRIITLRYSYDLDEVRSVASEVFNFADEAPRTYEDRTLSAAEVGTYELNLFEVPPTRDLRLTDVIEQTSPAAEGRPETTIISFHYEDDRGGRVTVSNVSAAQLLGVARCRDPRLPTTADPNLNAILAANAACGYGVEIGLALGRGVRRLDAPTVELQVGQTIVLVHAPNAAQAVQMAQKLRAAN